MRNNRVAPIWKIIAVVAIIALVVGGIYWYNHRQTGPSKTPTSTSTSRSTSKGDPTSASAQDAKDTPPSTGIDAKLTWKLREAVTDDQNPSGKPIAVDDMKLAKGSCHAKVIDASKGLVLPDPACTPGGIDTSITQANIDKTICTSGYTSDHMRPPASATNKLKANSYDAYGIAVNKNVEADHLISLQLGGATTMSNIWTEPNRDGAPSTTNPKDDVENKLSAMVCNHLVSLHDAQVAIALDWVHAYDNLGVKINGGQICRPSINKCVDASKHGDDD